MTSFDDQLLDSEVHMHDQGVIKNHWRAQSSLWELTRLDQQEPCWVKHKTVSSCWDEIKTVTWQLLTSSPKFLVHGYNIERIFHPFLVRSSREQTNKSQYEFDICRASKKNLSEFQLTIWMSRPGQVFVKILGRWLWEIREGGRAPPLDPALKRCLVKYQNFACCCGNWRS